MSRLQTRVLYGLRTDIAGNANYLTDDEIVYLVGNTLSVHNFPQNRQRLSRLPEKRKINFMTVSPNKKYAALGEWGDKPIITIYELTTLRKKKMFGVPSDSYGVTNFMSACFTCDSKNIAAVTNETQTMLVYNIEKGKIESSLPVGNPQILSSKVQLISCNPSDTAIIALGGLYVFQFLTLSETVWRPYGFSKADNFAIISLCWLNSDRLLAGTVDGRILFLENGDLKNIYTMSDTTVMNLKIKEEFVVPSSGSEPSINESQQQHIQEIPSIISFNRGFAFGMGYGKIIVFEKESPFKYSKRNVYQIPSKILNNTEVSLFRINTIGANESCDRLLVTTGWSQIFYVSLWGLEHEEEAEPEPAKILGSNLHHGPIGGLSICTWKSIIVTFGTLDRSVRLWNYEKQTLIIMKQYLQEISCTILHPSGLFCLIGFSDKLRFTSILIDDFFAIKEFPIRSCKRATFSTGGHFFAAVNANVIEVYSAIDFKVRYRLKGHIEVIAGMTWSQDDNKLVSIGTEGAIYQWNTHNGQRLAELVLKGVTLYGVVLSSDGTIVYCISSDNYIYEIKGNLILHTYSAPHIVPRKIATGKHDLSMYVASPGGFVASLKCPFQNPLEYQEYHVHCADITKMKLTYDEQMLVTTAMDGSMCFWKVMYSDGKTASMYQDLLALDQILIGRDNLANKVRNIRDLTARLKELETEHAYKVRQTSLQHNEKVLEIHQSYCQVIEELRDKIAKLELDHTNEINNINVDIHKMKDENEEAMRLMEINYDAKLIVEYDKNSSLQKRCDSMAQECEEKMAKLMKEGKELLDATIDKYKGLMQEKEFQLEDANQEMAEQVRIHEIIKTQMEEDTDREIVDVRAGYEAQLHKERQITLKLKGEAGVLKNKQKDCRAEVEDIKWQLNNLREEYNQLTARKEELEKQVMALKDELVNRESMIIDKNKNIRDLDSSNKELEKHKFVLNEHISELQSKIKPLDDEIIELKETVADMETELMGLNRIRQRGDLRFSEMNGKLVALKKELEREERRRKNFEKLMRKIQVDLLEAVGLIKEPTDLKNCVIKLYRRYSDVEEFLRNHKADMDAQCEFMKQRNHLERTIGLLRKQLDHNNPHIEAQLDKMLEENIMLITELNSAKEELKSMQEYIADIENLLGLRTHNVTPQEARAKLAKALHGYDELEHKYKMQIEEYEKIIEVLKEELHNLNCKH